MCLVAAARAQAPDQQITARSAIPIQESLTGVLPVDISVSIHNEEGSMVDDLEADDFEISDDGVPQKITRFSLGGEAISLVVVLETSSHIGPILPQIRRTGVLISQTVMGPTGQGAVVGFDKDVNVLANFTNSSDKIEKTISDLKEGDVAARLFDAMSKAVEMLSTQPPKCATDLGTRRVMLVIAEAHDTGSEDTLEEVLRRAQTANITIYSVGISGARADLTRNSEPEPARTAIPEGVFGMPPPPGTVQTPTSLPSGNLLGLPIWVIERARDKMTAHKLDIASIDSGGTYVSAWKRRSIENAIDKVGAELHSQYTISYNRHSDNRERYHEIKVTVKRDHLNVRVPLGYYSRACSQFP
jgi:VWFA-related protein